MTKSLCSYWLSSAAILGFAAGAHAQAPSPPPAAASPDDTGGLEQIVVTARKRSETLQNIPVAVTAYTPAQIQRYDISSIERIASSTPNLIVGRSAFGSGAQISLRGIGTPATAFGVDSSTAVVIDGTYYGNGRVLNEGLFDLASIQVLKGPQALFFGKNATAGVISVDTANPTQHFQATSKVGYEFKAQQVYAEQIVSGPITSNFGARLALHVSKMFGGYVTNRATPVTYTINDAANPATPLQTVTTANAAPKSPHEREFMGRLTLQWQPTDQLTDTLKSSGTIDRTNDPMWNNIVSSCSTGFSTIQPSQPCQRDWVYFHNPMPVQVAANFPHAKKDGGLYSDYRSAQVTNILEYKAGDITLTSNTNFQYQNNAWAAANNNWQRVLQIYSAAKERWHTISEEARATTNFSGMLNGMVGMLYQRTWVYSNQAVYVGNTQFSTAPAQYQYVQFAKDSTTQGETLSPFAQVMLKPSSKWEISAGVRYTRETKNSFYIMPFVRPPATYRQNVPIYADQLFKNASPEATIAYKPTSNINIYGSYKTGYKSGGFSNGSSYTTFSSPADLQFNPEKAKGFEGGAKITTLDNQLRLQIALFSYKYTDLQVDFYDSSILRYITTNAGSARTKGVELNFDYAPRAIRGLSVHGALNYDKAYYISYLAPCNTGQTPAGGCVTTTNSPYGGSLIQDLSGKPTANAPKWTAALGGNYEVDVGHDHRIGLSVEGRYSSRYNASAFYNPLAFQRQYANLDASVYFHAGDRWELAVIGRNLTNMFVINGAVDATSSGSGTGTPAGVLADQRTFANVPRTVQAQVTFHY